MAWNWWRNWIFCWVYWRSTSVVHMLGSVAYIHHMLKANLLRIRSQDTLVFWWFLPLVFWAEFFYAESKSLCYELTFNDTSLKSNYGRFGLEHTPLSICLSSAKITRGLEWKVVSSMAHLYKQAQIACALGSITKRRASVEKLSFHDGLDQTL